MSKTDELTESVESVLAAKGLLSPQALADYLDVPIGTIYRWRYHGDGPKSMKVGRHVRYRMADVERWLDRNAS